VYEDGCEQDDGFEWEGTERAECTECNWKGTANDIDDELDEPSLSGSADS